MTILEIMAIMVVTTYLAKTSGEFMNKFLKSKAKKLNIDQTQFTVLRRLIVFSIYSLGILSSASLIPGFSSLGTSIMASAGIFALVIGFAAQHTFANIISGIFIALFEPFRVGDKVQFGDDFGTVEDITLRHTIIRTWEEKRIIIPNSKISEESIINYTLKNARMLGTLEIGISYDSDIKRAREIMIEETFKHPDLLRDVRGDDNSFLTKDELAVVRLIALTDFAQNLRLYYWASDKTSAIKMKFDLNESIKERFDEEGIEIPFPYRTIVYKTDIDKGGN